MKALLICGLFLLNAQVFAANKKESDKGNGGSASESLIVAQQAQLETVALKLRTFFLKNQAILKAEFPEFDISVLAKKIKSSDIRVVDENKLIDKHGKSRTCLNFPDTSLIECKYKGIEPLLNEPAALFVLVLHEYLGLIGVEETTPANPTMISGYKISKRIAPYVTKVNDYDLIIPKKEVEVTKTINRDEWPATVKEAQGLANCFEQKNLAYDRILEERKSLERELFEITHSTSGVDKTREFSVEADLIGINSKISLIDKQMPNPYMWIGSSKSNEAQRKFELFQVYCSGYGVELIRE